MIEWILTSLLCESHALIASGLLYEVRANDAILVVIQVQSLIGSNESCREEVVDLNTMNRLAIQYTVFM